MITGRTTAKVLGVIAAVALGGVMVFCILWLAGQTGFTAKMMWWRAEPAEFIWNERLPAPERQTYAGDEVMWFGATGNRIVMCWGDGGITSLSIDSNEVTVGDRLTDYDNQRTQFIFSGGDRPLAAIIQGRMSTEEISFVDGSSGKIVSRTEVDYMKWQWAIGFGEQERNLWGMNDESVLKVNVATGKVEQEVKINRTGSPFGVRVSPDGASYAVFQGSDGEGHQVDGKKKWSISFGKNKFVELLTPQAEWPLAVVYVEDGETERNDVVAVDMEDGKRLWERKMSKYRDLAAISHDGKRQLWCDGNDVKIGFMPDKKVLKVNSMHGRVDGAFMRDGKVVACMPALEIVREDKDKNSYTLARKSRDIWLVDSDTGNVTKRIQLRR